MKALLSPMASAVMVGCAALATLSAPNRELWYVWVTLAAVALLVATVTRDW